MIDDYGRTITKNGNDYTVTDTNGTTFTVSNVSMAGALSTINAMAPALIPAQVVLTEADKAKNAIAFFQGLMFQFETMNKDAGLTEAQNDSILLSLQYVKLAMDAGTIGPVLIEISKVTPTAILPQQVLDAFAAQIKAYEAANS